jgi:hypothetical protein
MFSVMKNQRLRTLFAVALAALGCAPVAGFAQSILLSASDFALLANSTITNTGPTDVLNGNVGLSPGTAVVGFPPGTVTGGSVIIGGASAQAELDLITLASALGNMTPTEDLTGTDLGNLTLLPGVYKFDSSAALDGTLTLNANGENGAFWVFQIGTTLGTSASSNVTIINLGSNGGSDDGIFWDAGTAITFGPGSQILGNYLAGSAITSEDGTTGDGRALAQTAITLDDSTINSQGGPDGSDYSGGLMYAENGTIVPIVVPEPAASLWLAPLCAIGVVLWWGPGRRRQR